MCTDADSPWGPQSPASWPSEAHPRGHVRSRTRDRPHGVTWTRDTLSQGRLHSSGEGGQWRLMMSSGAQSQGWAAILTSDGAGDDHDGENEDGEYPAGNLSSPLAPLRREYAQNNMTVELGHEGFMR